MSKQLLRNTTVSSPTSPSVATDLAADPVGKHPAEYVGIVKIAGHPATAMEPHQHDPSFEAAAACSSAAAGHQAVQCPRSARRDQHRTVRRLHARARARPEGLAHAAGSALRPVQPQAVWRSPGRARGNAQLRRRGGYASHTSPPKGLHDNQCDPGRRRRPIMTGRLPVRSGSHCARRRSHQEPSGPR